jgi:hypothetical protein
MRDLDASSGAAGIITTDYVTEKPKLNTLEYEIKKLRSKSMSLNRQELHCWMIII